VKLQAEMGSTLHIAQNSLDELKVGVVRVMHEEADLLHRMGQVRAREGEVLESARQAPVMRRIGDMMTILPRELRLGVQWGRDRIAVKHISPFKEFNGILLLRQE
jgi:hypothetical protein